MDENSTRNMIPDGRRRYSFESHEKEEVSNWPLHQPQSINGTISTSPNHGAQRRGTWFTWWKLELLNVLLSTACMLAIVGILLGYQNRLLSSWPYARFSLNSAIALLATVARTSLLFAVTASIGQRKWQWFLSNSSRGRRVDGGGNQRMFRDFEALDDSSRGLLGSVNFFGKIGFKYVVESDWNCM